MDFREERIVQLQLSDPADADLHSRLLLGDGVSMPGRALPRQDLAIFAPLNCL